MNTFHKRGEVVTIVALGALILIGITTFVASSFLPKKNTSKTKAATNTDLCTSVPSVGDACDEAATPYCDSCTSNPNDGCKKSGDGGEAQVWKCVDGKWQKLYGECNSLCAGVGPAVSTSTPIPTLAPGTTGYCKKSDGSQGETCDDLSTCNVDGKCDNLVCCKRDSIRTTSNGYLQKCDIANGACSSGYQWRNYTGSYYCKDKNGNQGQVCDSLDYCDQNGGCNSACCKTDSQCNNENNNYSKCDVANSFCNSGTSCNTKRSPTAVPSPSNTPTPINLTPTPTPLADHAPDCQVGVEFPNNKNFPGEITVKSLVVTENNHAGIYGEGNFYVYNEENNQIGACEDGSGSKPPPWSCKIKIEKSGKYAVNLYVKSTRNYLTNRCKSNFYIADPQNPQTFASPAISPPVLSENKVTIRTTITGTLINCSSNYHILYLSTIWWPIGMTQRHNNVNFDKAVTSTIETQLNKNNITYSTYASLVIQESSGNYIYAYSDTQHVTATSDQNLNFQIDYKCNDGRGT